MRYANRATMLFCVFLYQASEELKLRVLDLLDQDTLYMLAMHTDGEVVIKTLGVLNNILSTVPVSMCLSIIFYFPV